MIRASGERGLDGTAARRGIVPALTSPHPLGGYLPALYQEDDFAQRFTSALDEVLAPIFGSLDNFEAYLDPSLAPEDFVDWLGTWMGLVLDETWPLDRRRAFVSQASALYRLRGTPKGLAAHVEIFTGGEVEVIEGGGVSWSAKSGGPLPGSANSSIVVRVRLDSPALVDQSRLNALVADAKPAHLAHRVEVVAKSVPVSAAPSIEPPAEPPETPRQDPAG